MTQILRNAINEALKHLEGEVHDNLKKALWSEGTNQEIEDQKVKGWDHSCERPIGDYVNPKVFFGKRIYNNWSVANGIHVAFTDGTAYEITMGERLEMKRVR